MKINNMLRSQLIDDLTKAVTLTFANAKEAPGKIGFVLSSSRNRMVDVVKDTDPKPVTDFDKDEMARKFVLLVTNGYDVDYYEPTLEEFLPEIKYIISKPRLDSTKEAIANAVKSSMNEPSKTPADYNDRPERYSGAKGDLLDSFEGYILTYDEMIGAYKFNIIKYVRRFNQKGGMDDLKKAEVYLKRLKDYYEKGDSRDDEDDN